MIIKRDYYLRQLIQGQKNGLIKIITGIRRCGKSFLLSRIFGTWLLENGVSDSHIIHIPLDDKKNASMRDPNEFLRYVDESVADDNWYYLLIDEIQLMDDFVEVLNSLLYRDNIDVYVTGSNSRMLSRDVVTEFRGRGDEIHMYPLSFAEYMSCCGLDRTIAWRNYYTFGGLPQVALMDDELKKMNYLSNLMQTVFLRDVVERHKVNNESELMELIEILSSSIGAPTNPTKISNSFLSVKKIKLSQPTISKYITYFLDAFLIEKAMRYNIKGRKYINSLSKYYFTDMGLRNAVLNFRQLEESHIMENVIYNELRMRGFRVDVGIVETREENQEGKYVRKQLEVDFVANSGNKRYYIQSALSIPSREKRQQETASFQAIDDSFEKIIIVRDDIMPYIDEKGYRIIGLFDFLLNPNVLSN